MSWTDKLKDYAPDIATAILTGGASLPQLALKAIGDATGSQVSTIEQLQSAVETADPATMLKITQANNSFKLRMKELSNDLTASELTDKQNAREQHKHSKMPAVITCLLTFMVSGLLYSIMHTELTANNHDLAMMMFGQVFALWGASITYWVGTTRSSANKDKKQ